MNQIDLEKRKESTMRSTEEKLMVSLIHSSFDIQMFPCYLRDIYLIQKHSFLQQYKINVLIYLLLSFNLCHQMGV